MAVSSSGSGAAINDTSHEHDQDRENENGDAAQHDASAQGRQRRFSEYAEATANPLPEIAVASDPEPVSNLNQLACDDTASARPAVQPDDPVDRRSSAVVYAGEEPSRFRKYRTPIIIVLIVLVIILTGTVVGVVVANRSHGGSGENGTSTSSSSTPASSSATSSTSSSLSSASSTTTAAGSPVGSSTTISKSSSSTSSPTQPSSSSPSQTSTPSQCADTSKWLKNVSFMNIVGGTNYKYTFGGGTTNAAECCAYCYTKVPDGCDSWYWAVGNFSGTYCTMLYGWKGSNSDATCPNGHTAVNFVQDADNETYVGGVGPCATLALS